ncbi:MAG TPA: hypothetical protein PKY05_12040 [Fibrobacteria bacterium]|nr:hypothetical protein [Fibrobacteria bacterium]
MRTSIHLCHELKAGNADRLDAIVAKSAPFLALASVSGADEPSAFTPRWGWDRLIKPLDAGGYDPRPFLRALARNGFEGPVQLHTYGLKSPVAPDYDRHIERSMGRWRELVSGPESPSGSRFEAVR